MPNHLHGIIIINNPVGATLCGRPDPIIIKRPDQTIKQGQAHRPAPTKNIPILGDIVGWFKTMTTNYYIHGIKNNHWPWFAGRLWQRNYYEHIIRNQKSLNRIRNYIKNNPENWEFDRNNPKNIK